MDNPWATHDQDWPSKWPESRDSVWTQGDASWDAQDANSEHLSDQQPSPHRDPSDAAPETTEATASSISDGENPADPPEDGWTAPWSSTPSGTDPKSPDQWETARQEKEKRNRAVPPELLDSLLRHCQQVSQEIWPTSENNSQDDWRSGFDSHADIAALLAQLLPNDTSLPSLQFSVTATTTAMNEALKLTRHLPTASSSPLSRLLASKGSLEWEKSIKTKTKQEIVSDAPHTGWRVLEKEDRLNTTEESKPRKATGGLLSFWNRRASAIPATPAEAPTERSSSPVRSSLEAIKSLPHPSQAVSPSDAPSPLSPPTDTPTVVIATAPAASAVSRFLNRFSRARGPQHTSLALSADDLEFLSDVVPSASDPPDEDADDSPLGTLMGVSNSSPLPPKLPPPIPPPPKQALSSSRPSSALGFGASNGGSSAESAPTATQSANHMSNVPVLAPPLSPRPAASFLHTKSPPLSPKDVVIPTAMSGLSSAASVQQRSSPGPQSNPSSFKLSLPHRSPPLLSIPPLLPPPPVSPPQTPRPSAFPSMTPGRSPIRDSSSFHYDSDDEFSAFASFPPASFPSSEPPQEPPSPPPRHTYERTHYPSSSSASSILSPASQTSLEQLCIAASSTSASLDGFDDFVSSSPVVGREKRTPSPPPLPIKSQFQHPQPSRIDTLTSRVHNPYSPSQNVASPTVHTNLLNSPFPVPSVSNAERRRTQNLVDHAAACGGLVWPNSPISDGPKVQAIPPPPSSSTSPRPVLVQEHFDLLGDGDTLGSGLEFFGARMGSTAAPARDALRMPHGVGKGPGVRNQLQPSPPSSTSASVFSSSSLGTSVPLAAPGSLQPIKPKQTGGLSAQDLSFFEGL